VCKSALRCGSVFSSSSLLSTTQIGIYHCLGEWVSLRSLLCTIDIAICCCFESVALLLKLCLDGEELSWLDVRDDKRRVCMREREAVLIHRYPAPGWWWQRRQWWGVVVVVMLVVVVVMMMVVVSGRDGGGCGLRWRMVALNECVL
jgi:hypothetical protein